MFRFEARLSIDSDGYVQILCPDMFVAEWVKALNYELLCAMVTSSNVQLFRYWNFTRVISLGIQNYHNYINYPYNSVWMAHVIQLYIILAIHSSGLIVHMSALAAMVFAALNKMNHFKILCKGNWLLHFRILCMVVCGCLFDMHFKSLFFKVIVTLHYWVHNILCAYTSHREYHNEKNRYLAS